MKPCRILIVIPGAAIGGVVTGLAGIFKPLTDAGYEITLATLQSGPVVDFFRRQKIKCIVLPSKNRLNYIRQLVIRKKIQLIQSCDAAGEGALVAKQLGLPHVWHIGGRIDTVFKAPSGKSLRAFKLMIKLLSDAIVVQSRSLIEDIFPDLPKRMVHHIPWGIRPAKISTAPRPSNGSTVIGMAGNFYPAKNHSDFLKAVSIIHKKFPRTKFLIAGRVIQYPGSARYRKKILKTIKDLNLSRVVEVTYFSHQELDWYHGLNLFVVPSQETISQAMLEAGSRGVPVVAVDTGGIRDVIHTQKVGLLVPYRQPEKLAAAALKIINNPKLSRRLSKNIRRRIQTEFPTSKQAGKFNRLYKELLAAQAN